MIKSLIILALLVVLVAGAFLTRPSAASFETFVKSTAAPAKLSLAGVVGGLETDSYLHSITFHDRLLWTFVAQNGQTQYVGAFGHWFTTGSAPTNKS